MKTAEEKLVNLAKFVKERDGLVSKESLQESVKKSFLSAKIEESFTVMSLLLGLAKLRANLSAIQF